jgi:uncharacterized protein YkwD
MPSPARSLFFLALLAAPLSSHAAPAGTSQLAQLINAFRANPPACEGARTARTAPLALRSELFNVRLERGLLLENAMKNAGYRSEYAGAVSVAGPLDARAAMAAIEGPYCALLTSERFNDIGVLRNGDEWVVLLATPYRPPVLAEWPQAGQTILAAVNAARAVPRRCGERAFGAAPPVTWNDLLGKAALGHSRDMAQRVYFDHREKDGSDAAERVQRLGYRWSRVGENIASGLGTPEEAVQGWIDSPGHCANLMNPGYTQMGAAYAINHATELGTLYWTQVFATPR